MPRWRTSDPRRSDPSVATTSPCTWNSGSAWTSTSSAVQLQAAASASRFAAIARADSTTPFDGPVVPLVNTIRPPLAERSSAIAPSPTPIARRRDRRQTRDRGALLGQQRRRPADPDDARDLGRSRPRIDRHDVQPGAERGAEADRRARVGHGPQRDRSLGGQARPQARLPRGRAGQRVSEPSGKETAGASAGPASAGSSGMRGR